MKIKNLFFALLLGMFVIQAYHVNGQEYSADQFLGIWALDLDYESSNAGWMEIRQEDGYLDASVLWQGGSVTPVEFVYTAENHLMITRVVREKDESGEPVREHRQLFR